MSLFDLKFTTMLNPEDRSPDPRSHQRDIFSFCVMSLLKLIPNTLKIQITFEYPNSYQTSLPFYVQHTVHAGTIHSSFENVQMLIFAFKHKDYFARPHLIWVAYSLKIETNTMEM